jgi:hypothetical protein
VQDPGQPGDREDPGHRRHRVPQDQVAAEPLHPAVRRDQHAEPGRVDRVDRLQVDDHVALGRVDQVVQLLPGVADAAHVQIPGQPDDVLLLLYIHRAAPWFGRDGAEASRKDARR